MDDSVIGTEVAAWLATNWDPSLPLREWRERFVASGWAAPSWPEPIGKGLPPTADAIVEAELERAGAVGTPIGVGMGLAAPAILQFGPDEARAALLRPILTGEHTWCQLFSEPGSGSDLAGLTTSAVQDGDEWIVNGQKVWNTSAHHADYGLLLARTNWDVPKHQGITCFALPMRQGGVDVRPLRQMNGYSSFNEVFMTDARVPAANVIGEVGNGWAVARAVLVLERHSFAMFSRRRAPRLAPGGADAGRALAEAAAEADSYFGVYRWYPQRAGRVDLVVPRAQETGRGDDPVARQAIVRAVTEERVAAWSTGRAIAARTAGRPAGPEGSLAKLTASEIARKSAAAHTAISGAAGMLTGADGPGDGVISEVFVSVPAISIAGGTDEIQHNIIGERVLGLPRDADVDTDIPFRDVPRNVR